MQAIYTVARIHGGHYVICPNCARKPGETEDQMKIRYITDRYNYYAKKLKDEYGVAGPELNIEEQLKNYLFIKQ